MTQQPYGPPQGYPGTQPGYAPQAQFQQPVYQPDPYQQQGYVQQQPQWGPPPQQGQYSPFPPQQQAPAVDTRGSLNGFFAQPAGGSGPGLKFERLGDRYVGTVVRDITDADIHKQTKMMPRPGEDPLERHPDGRPKEQMWIGLIVPPSPQFPQGEATWYVKTNERQSLLDAMRAAGVQPDENGVLPIRGGDTIDITYVANKPNRGGMNDTKVKKIIYTPGNGQAPQPAYMQQAVAPQQAAQPQQWQQPQAQPQLPPQAQQQWAQQLPQQFQQAVPQAQPLPQQQFDTQAYQQFQQQPQFQAQPAPQYQQAPQQVPTSALPAGAPSGFAPGAPGTAPASPSNGTPPPDWPADLPFVQGLTPDMVRTAMTMGLPLNQ